MELLGLPPDSSEVVLALVSGALMGQLLRRLKPLLVSVGARFVRFLTPKLKAAVWSGWHVLIGISLAMILIVSDLAGAESGQLFVRAFLALVSILSWRGYREIHELNERQIEYLGEIWRGMDDHAADGGSRKRPGSGKDFSGAVVGGIAGALLGSTFGPEGAIIGGFVGAALLDDTNDTDGRDENLTFEEFQS